MVPRRSESRPRNKQRAEGARGGRERERERERERGESSPSVHPPTHLGTRGCCTSGDRRRTASRARRPPGLSPWTRRAMAPSSDPSLRGGCASAAPRRRRPSGRWRRRTAACGACPRTRWAATRTPPSLPLPPTSSSPRATRREIGAPGGTGVVAGGEGGGSARRRHARTHAHAGAGRRLVDCVGGFPRGTGRDGTSRAARRGARRGATRTLWWRWGVVVVVAWWERE